MPDAAISPSTVGEQIYTITDSKGFIADLGLTVRLLPPAVFEISYPAASNGVNIKLRRGDASLDLSSGTIDDSSTFASRRVLSNIEDTGDAVLLNCSISALAKPASGESWRVEVSGGAATTYQLRQMNNDVAQPTITRLMCDPAAHFTLAGDVELDAGEATVAASGKVLLKARDATISPAVVKADSAAAPEAHYKWTCTGDAAPPDFPACGTSPELSFIAPDTDSQLSLNLELEIWFEGACPSNVGMLNSHASQSLTVTSGTGSALEPEEEVVRWGEDYAAYLFDGDNLIAVSAMGDVYLTNIPLTADAGERLAAFLKGVKVAAGGVFNSQPGPYIISHEGAHAALLPNGDVVVAYAKTRSQSILNAEGEPENEIVSSSVVFKIGQPHNYELPEAKDLDIANLPEQTIERTQDGNVYYEDIFVVVAGEIVHFFYRRPLTGIPSGSNATLLNDCFHRRFRYTDKSWVDGTPIGWPSFAKERSAPHGAGDPSGNAWIAAVSTQNTPGYFLIEDKLPPTGEGRHFTVGQGVFKPGHVSGFTPAAPFVLCRRGGDVLVFLTRPEVTVTPMPSAFNSEPFEPEPPPAPKTWSGGITYIHHPATDGITNWQVLQETPEFLIDSTNPHAVEDGEGGIWLFWNKQLPNIPTVQLFFTRHDLQTQHWEPPRLLTDDGYLKHVGLAPDNIIWAFFTRYADGDTGDTRLHQRRIRLAH